MIGDKRGNYIGDSAWANKVWLRNKQFLLNCLTFQDLIFTEQIKDTNLKKLDLASGIDAIALKGNRIISLSLRTQIIKKPYQPYNTFTIRLAKSNLAKTEYEKRLQSIKENKEIYPTYTVQMYVDADLHPLSIAIIGTKELYSFAVLNFENNELVKFNRAKSDGNNFLYINFKDLQLKRYWNNADIEKQVDGLRL